MRRNALQTPSELSCPWALLLMKSWWLMEAAKTGMVSQHMACRCMAWMLLSWVQFAGNNSYHDHARQWQAVWLPAVAHALAHAWACATTSLCLFFSLRFKSQRRTREIVASMGVPVLLSQAGRARQMNLGASAATGDHTLQLSMSFLHCLCQSRVAFAAMPTCLL